MQSLTQCKCPGTALRASQTGFPLNRAMQIVRLALLAASVFAADDHGDGSYEWAGIFPLPEDYYLWTAQSVLNTDVEVSPCAHRANGAGYVRANAACLCRANAAEPRQHAHAGVMPHARVGPIRERVPFPHAGLTSRSHCGSHTRLAMLIRR